MKKKITQADENPYKNSDSNKRYYTYDYYLRRTFGEKCAKIMLDCGFGCPNSRIHEDLGDGNPRGGCVFCEYGGRSRPGLPPIEEQYRLGRERISLKWQAGKFIAYLNAGTNTNAPEPVLRGLYNRVLDLPGVAGLNIATRADCLPPGVVLLLADISRKTLLTVELGMQTCHDRTAAAINRGYGWDEFLSGYRRLRAVGSIGICLHLIFGLPGEDAAMMLESVRAAAMLSPEQIKLHLLYTAPGTQIWQAYERGDYVPMERGEYIDTVCRAIELIPPETVICRLTGDGPAGSVPEWSRRKVSVINDIDKLLYERRTWQGRKYRSK